MVDLLGQRHAQFVWRVTDVDGNNVGHCEECREASSDLRKELGILTFLILTVVGISVLETPSRFGGNPRDLNLQVERLDRR
jgi:hypothetical protein